MNDQISDEKMNEEITNDPENLVNLLLTNIVICHIN